MDIMSRLKKIEYFNTLGVEFQHVLDPLTQIVARKYILDYIEYLTLTKQTYMLVITDIDNFKSLNDTYGHPTGDEVIAKLAKILGDSINKDSIIGRYGGDEFVIIIPEVETYDDRWNELRRIHESARRPITLGSWESINITVTSGCALFPKDGQTSSDIFIKADKALYRGKEKGRNCYIIYSDERHKDLKFKAAMPMSEKMRKIRKAFNDSNGFRFQIYEAMIKLLDIVNVDGVGYFSKASVPLIYNGNLSTHLKSIDFNTLNNYYNDGIVKINKLDDMPEHGYLVEYLKENGIKSALITKVENDDKNDGYLMLYSIHNRVWQDSEVSLMIYLSDLIGFFQEKKKEA